MKYRIRTIAGGGLSLFVGGSVTTFEIQDATGSSAYYTLYGADFGVGFKAGGGSGPSSWTDFEANCGLNGFYGYVILKQAGANVGIGGGGMVMNFNSGPAAGVEIAGIGWSTGLGAQITATHGYMQYRS